KKQGILRSTGFCKVKLFYSRRKRPSVYREKAEPEGYEEACNNEENDFTQQKRAEGCNSALCSESIRGVIRMVLGEKSIRL
ncbi:MAG: hypothetical protein J6U96_05745, partial [Elusimicrobiaceae bacterium]|nr:hypothetical protein [Elusimicrobiaceae bacterium]